jgi:hypothetical protein
MPREPVSHLGVALKQLRRTQMNDESKQTQAVVEEFAAEMRRFRLTLLVSFAIFSFIGGLVLLCYPSYWIPLGAFFVASAVFSVWAIFPRLTKLASAVREEVRLQNSPRSPTSGQK